MLYTFSCPSLDAHAPRLCLPEALTPCAAPLIRFLGNNLIPRTKGGGASDSALTDCHNYPWSNQLEVLIMAMLQVLLAVSCFVAVSCVPLPRASPKGFGTAKYAIILGCDGLGECLQTVVVIMVIHVYPCTLTYVANFESPFDHNHPSSPFIHAHSQEVCMWRMPLPSSLTSTSSISMGRRPPGLGTRCHPSLHPTGAPSSQDRDQRSLGSLTTRGLLQMTTLQTLPSHTCLLYLEQLRCTCIYNLSTFIVGIHH